MSEQTDNELQEIANRVNLGKHQTLIIAEDEEGRTGRWVVHRPNMRDELRIGVLYSQSKTPDDTNNPIEIDDMRDNLAFIIATLNVVVDLRPDWFPKDAGECFDARLVSDLFDKYCEWKNSFRRHVSGEPGEDS